MRTGQTSTISVKATPMTLTLFGSNRLYVSTNKMQLPAALQINILGRHPADAMPHTTRAALQRSARRVYRNILPLFLPVIFCVLFNTPLVYVGLAVVPLVFVVRWFALGSPVPLTRANPIVLVLEGAF